MTAQEIVQKARAESRQAVDELLDQNWDADNATEVCVDVAVRSFCESLLAAAPRTQIVIGEDALGHPVHAEYLSVLEIEAMLEVLNAS